MCASRYMPINKRSTAEIISVLKASTSSIFDDKNDSGDSGYLMGQ